MARQSFRSHPAMDSFDVSPDLAIPAAVADGIDSVPTSPATRVAPFLARAFGPTMLAAIHYGSHARPSDARADSVHDFFVVVVDYGAAFRHLNATIGTRYSPVTATFLARWLPPNVVAFTIPLDGQAVSVKCAVYDSAHFLEATSRQARDHFAHGRLFQCVQLAWAEDSAAREFVTRALVATRVLTFEWVRDELPSTFDVDGYLRVLLYRSFAWEIRPETADRVAVLVEAQLPFLRCPYRALLDTLVTAGELKRLSDGGYQLVVPPRLAESRRLRRYFARSKRRATLRWAKHVALYDDWLGYITRKIERRSDMHVELTAREQRWPLVFLWPRVIRFVRNRPERGVQ